MKQYDVNSLVVHSGNANNPEVVVELSPKLAGWKTLDFQVRRLKKGSQWSQQFEQTENAIVMLSGTADMHTDHGDWEGVGARASVFSGLPYALYVPMKTSLSVTAQTDCEFAIASTPATEPFPAKLISPADVTVEIRGGDHATRQINNIIPPGFACQHLVVVEVYTPGGNWSSYPPHKHDNRRIDTDGTLLEADLDEIYYYKIDPPDGYAIQRIYTDDTSPLQKAGKGFDVPVLIKNNDIALVPEGYHPVSSPPGYTTYYLNILAGSDQVLTSKDDPIYAWIKDSYKSLDPRVPIYPIN